MICYSRLSRPLCLFLLLVLLSSTAWSRHLVGGDLTYRCLGTNNLGQNQYQLFLNIYRDCLPNGQFSTNTPFDKVVEVYVYNGSNMGLYRIIEINLGDSVILPITSPDTCAPAPNNLCYTTTSYATSINLPDNESGYYLAWGRCCRNESIANLNDPGNQGMVLSAYIPPTSLCNNSPFFLNTAPTFICANDNFTFDHSASDIDGDSLVYALTLPFTAGSKSDPFPTPTAPPYQPISWGAGYNNSNIMDGNPSLSIDPNTGLLTVRPRQLGQYVFSVSVYEYRDGLLLSEVKRDIQINVVDCPINFPPTIIRPEVTGLSGDTLTFLKGREGCFEFTVEDINGIGVDPDFLAIEGVSELFAPPFNLRFEANDGFSPQTISICWAPSCNQDQLVDRRIILTATDNNDCPGPNVTYDTLVVQVVDADILAPQMRCASRTGGGETIVSWEPFAQGEELDFIRLNLYRTNGITEERIAIIDDPAINSYSDLGIPPSSTESYCYYLILEKDCIGTSVSEPSAPVCTEDAFPSDLCEVSFLPGDQGLSVSWTPFNGVNFDRYELWRSVNEQEFELIYTETRQSTINFQDSTAPENQYICYYLKVTDECGVELESGIDCAMPLQIQESNFDLLLDWEAYNGWNQGVQFYEIWRQRPDSSLELVGTAPNTDTRFVDRNINNDQARYCYQIRAVANPGECSDGAWSWEQCFDFDPLLYVPNAFSPNNDGRNDLFQVRGAFVPQVQLNIYNRWGQQIFVSNSLDQGWDGTYQGRAVPEGVYVFQLSFVTLEGQSLRRSGSITLIR